MGFSHTMLGDDQPTTKLLNQARHMMRLKQYTFSTERSYLNWMQHFIHIHTVRHPRSMGKEQIESFLSLEERKSNLKPCKNEFSDFIIQKGSGFQILQKRLAKRELWKSNRDHP